MIPWRIGIPLFAQFLVLIPRVSTELKDSIVSVGHDHLRRVSVVQNVSSDVVVEPSMQQSEEKLIEAELMKRAGLAGEDPEPAHGNVDKTNKNKRKNKEEPVVLTKPTFHGERFDELLKKKEVRTNTEDGHWEQQISSNPTVAFDNLFKPADGLLAENNEFIDHVCEYNHKMPKPIVRLKVMVFDAWLMFTHHGTPEARPGPQSRHATANNVQDASDRTDGEKGKFKRDIVRFKEVILHYRPDIVEDLSVNEKDKKKKDVAEKLERMFDLHLKRCWEVARAMNPVARDRMFKLDPALKANLKEMPWMRMHEFAYIFILAFGFAGLPKDKDHWQHADWLGLIDWTNPKKAKPVLKSKIPSMATPENAKPGGDARYKPRIITGDRREYNFDLLDKWSQQLASDRSSVSGKYVKFVHVSYTAGWSLENEFTREDTKGEDTMVRVKEVTGKHTKDSGVEAKMLLVKINRQLYSEALWKEATSEKKWPVYTLSFMEEKYRPLYEMEFANGAIDNLSPRDEGYVQFPIFVDIESKAYQSQDKQNQAHRSHRLKTKGANDGEQYPDKGFDDLDGLIDFREVDEEAWWWNTEEKKFSKKQGFTWKDIKDKVRVEVGDASNWYGPFQKIKLEDFLRHFMSQSLDMFTNLADASNLNHVTLDEPLEPDELPPRKEVTLHFDRKTEPGLELDPWTGKVKSVTSGGQADDFGVEVGWTTLKINGQRVISGRMQKQLKEAMEGRLEGYVETPIKHRNKDGEVVKIESRESANARAAPYTITFDRGKEKFAPLDDVARQGTAFEIRTANTNALKEYVLKDLRGRTRLNMDAFKFATDRMDEDYARHHLMEHIRAQYSWRSERNENYKRAKMSNTLQQKELQDYKDFLVAVWKAAETMVPFSRRKRHMRIGFIDLFRGEFISDPAFHYAAIVAQEFCWRHVREVKGIVRATTESGTATDTDSYQSFGRDTLMLIPLELPDSKQYSLLSTFEVQEQFKALEEFESFSGQDVEEHENEAGEKYLIRGEGSLNDTVSTVYRIPSQLLKDLPDPWIEHASKQVKKNEKAGYGSKREVTNWNHVTMNYLDGLFGGNVWADFPISEMSKPAEPPVSHALRGYLDELDSRDLARLRENQRQKNEHAFDDDPDEVANALKPALGRRDS